jgi:hypothetical protein
VPENKKRKYKDIKETNVLSGGRKTGSEKK